MSNGQDFEEKERERKIRRKSLLSHICGAGLVLRGIPDLEVKRFSFCRS